MIGLNGFDLGTKFVLGLVFLILLIAVPNCSQISEKLGFETTRSLKLKVQTLEKSITEKDEVIDKLQKEIDNQKNYISKITVIEEQVSKEKEEVQTVTQKHVALLKRPVVKKPIEKTNSSVSLEAVEIKTESDKESLNVITVLWKAHCEIEKLTTCPI